MDLTVNPREKLSNVVFNQLSKYKQFTDVMFPEIEKIMFQDFRRLESLPNIKLIAVEGS